MTGRVRYKDVRGQNRENLHGVSQGRLSATLLGLSNPKPKLHPSTNPKPKPNPDRLSDTLVRLSTHTRPEEANCFNEWIAFEAAMDVVGVRARDQNSERPKQRETRKARNRREQKSKRAGELWDSSESGRVAGAEEREQVRCGVVR